MRLRRWISALLLLASAGCARIPKQPALAKASGYLWSMQGEDGGWHSRTYGLLRSGQSLTPFVLDALLQVPADAGAPHDQNVSRAMAFIRSNTQPDGSLGTADPGIPDYPNYSTALAVRALCRARRTGWEEQVRRMTSYLRTQQFTEQNGWHRQDLVYGAWGTGGGRRTPPDTGHVDLSMTRFVIEAFHAAGIPASDPVFESARVFIERCQNSDGGFFFSTTEFDTNKAGQDGQRFRSYGTTTADGLLALLAAGARPDDARVLAAQRWLMEHHRDMSVPGFVGEAYHRWPRGMAFYYSAASLRAFRALGSDTGASVIEGLLRTQRADGSWSNPENLVKEDDPLIATSFAVRALAARLDVVH